MNNQEREPARSAHTGYSVPHVVVPNASCRSKLGTMLFFIGIGLGLISFFLPWYNSLDPATGEPIRILGFQGVNSISFILLLALTVLSVWSFKNEQVRRIFEPFRFFMVVLVVVVTSTLINTARPNPEEFGMLASQSPYSYAGGIGLIGLALMLMFVGAALATMRFNLKQS